MTSQSKAPKQPSKASKKDEVSQALDTINTPQVDPQEPPPTFTAITMHKLEGHGNSGWVVLKMIIKGDRVIDVESSEPNLRAIAVEQLKIDTVKLFFNPMG